MKKYLIFICFAILIIAFIPSSIVVKQVNNGLKQYDVLINQDIKVYGKSICGIMWKFNDFEINTTNLSDEENPIIVSSGPFKAQSIIKAIPVTKVKCTPKKHIFIKDTNIQESDYEVAYVYEDNSEKIVEDFDVKESTYINDSITIKTNFGETMCSVNVKENELINVTDNINKAIFCDELYMDTYIKDINPTIKIIHKDNTEENISLSDCIIENNDVLQYGKNKVKLNYNNTELILETFVKEKEIKDITLLDYEAYIGMEPMIEKISINYQDGTTKIVLDDFDILTKTIQQDTKKCEINYHDHIYNVDIIAKELTKVKEAYFKYKDEYDNADYKYLSDTSFVTIKKYIENNSVYFISHVVIESPEQIKGELSYGDWGGTRELATDASKRLNWVLGTNGSYFSYSTGCPVTCNVYIKNGKIMKDGLTNGKEVCLKNDGTLFSPEANIDVNVLLADGVVDIWGTADPLLIKNGEKQIIEKDKSYPRCAYGMVKPCEYYIITAGDGDYYKGLTFSQLQEKFYNLGCTYARSLDGGGSATLVFDDTLINNPAAGPQRPVVDFLYFID